MFTKDFFNRLMQWEGGYQNHESDTGNYNSCGARVGTNHGITSKTVETLMGVKCPDQAFMMAIDDDYAFMVLGKFWEFYRIDEIKEPLLANLVMNNFMGLPVAAAKAVQRACNQFQANLEVDGAMGSKTLAALNSLSDQNLGAIYNAVLKEWISYLNTTKEVFRQGLLNRVNDLFDTVYADPPNQEPVPNPVANTGGLERAKRILSGAAKGKAADLVAILAGLVGVITVFITVLKLSR